MNLVNYNNQLRDTLKTTIDTLKFDINHLRSMTEEEAIAKYRDVLYDLENSKKDKVVRESLIFCMFMDTYKLAIYKLKNGLLLDEDILFLETLFSLKDSDDILAQVSCDIDFFNNIILGGYRYASYDNLTKYLIDKCLSKEDRKKLTNLVPITFFDINNIMEKVTLPKLIDIIEIQVKKNEEIVDEQLLFVVLLKINGFIFNLYKLDKTEAITLLIDMIKFDYASCKYLNVFEDRINFYDNSSLEVIIDEIINNQYLLNNIIEMIFNVYIHKEYDNKKINTDEINKIDINDISKKLILK